MDISLVSGWIWSWNNTCVSEFSFADFFLIFFFSCSMEFAISSFFFYFFSFFFLASGALLNIWERAATVKCSCAYRLINIVGVNRGEGHRRVLPEEGMKNCCCTYVVSKLVSVVSFAWPLICRSGL